MGKNYVVKGRYEKKTKPGDTFIFISIFPFYFAAIYVYKEFSMVVLVGWEYEEWKIIVPLNTHIITFCITKR